MQRQSVVESMDRSDVRAACVCSAADQTNPLDKFASPGGGNIAKRDRMTSSMSSPHRTLTGCVVHLFVVYVFVRGLSSRSHVGRPPLCTCRVDHWYGCVASFAAKIRGYAADTQGI